MTMCILCSRGMKNCSCFIINCVGEKYKQLSVEDRDGYVLRKSITFFKPRSTSLISTEAYSWSSSHQSQDKWWQEPKDLEYYFS